MLASHDSFTYDTPTNPLLNLISIFWRCQKKDIKEQYDLGVRIFDIRVARYKNRWYGAHGFYRAKHINFNTISDVCKHFKLEFPNSMIRIYLENNVDGKNKNILDLYLQECEVAWNKYKDMLWEIGTHNPWITYYRNDNLPFVSIKEYYCHLFNWDLDKTFIDNIKQFDWSSWSLPLFSKKHNPIITQELKDDNIMHIMDYIGIYPKQKVS